MDCPDEDTLAQYLGGALNQRGITLIEEHVEDCEDCRFEVAGAAKEVALGRTIRTHGSPAPHPVLEQPPVERVGPFNLLKRRDEGGMGIVYRALSIQTGQLVALKRVKVTAPGVVSALRREVRALSRVDHPGVVRVIDQGVANGFPWYAMDFIEGETLDARIAAARNVEGGGGRCSFAQIVDVLRIVRRLCDTLAYLHGEGVVHRDLTPRNVIIRSGDLPILVDFGLASLSAESGREAIDAALERGGTPSYMAPEQIDSELVDARADLYALGCILYQIFTGKTPFARDDIRNLDQLLNAVQFAAAPPSPALVMPDLPPELAAMTLRLLAKRPRDRLGYAQDVSRALGRAGVDDVAPWRAPRPRSYTYRPALVGRGELLNDWNQMLSTCQAGRGGRVFVAGESGVGKTRLAVEAAASARAQRIRVVMGGSVALTPTAAGGAVTGSTLHAFQPLLRTIADQCQHRGRDFTEKMLGSHGRVLAACEPALADLPGQAERPNPPVLPAEAARFRLLTALDETLAAFANHAPLVLVLDDLQWADELSIAFLESLDARFLARNPVLILGTYRSEEATSELRLRLRAVADQHHELGRLGPAAVGEMVSDMLALSEPQPGLNAFLARESEGNPFFIGEYLRLAVDEGWLSRDDDGNWGVASKGGQALSRNEGLPIPSSLKVLLDQRLDRLSPATRQVVEFASVLGRTFEPDLLAVTPGVEADSVAMDAVNEAFARQVLEPAGVDGIRFVHDKIREAAYGHLAASRLVDLHATAARAIEAKASTDRGSQKTEHAAELAHHWRIAGDEARERPYRGRAGEKAFNVGAYRDAIAHLERALALTPPDAEREATATLECQLAEAYFGVGDMGASRKCIETLVARVGLPMPGGSLGMVATLLKDVAGVALRGATGSLLLTRSSAGRQAMTQAARAFERLGHILFFENQLLGVTTSSVRALAAASRLGPSPELARVYANLGLSVGLLPVHGLAHVLGRWAIKIAEEINDEPARNWARELEGVYKAGVGAWSEARECFGSAMKFWDRVGDRRRWEETLTLLGMTLYQSGDFAGAADLRLQLEAAGVASGSAQTLGWAWIGQAEDRLHRGEVAAAIAALERAQTLGPAVQRVEQVWLHGLLAKARLQQGDEEGARSAADAALKFLKGSVPTAFYVLEGYSGLCEVYLGLGGQQSREMVHLMNRFARVFPIAAPRAALWCGERELLRGRNSRAFAIWSEAVETARRLGRWEDEELIRRRLSDYGRM